MDIYNNYPQGYWQVGDKKFINKYQALLESKLNNNRYVRYDYFNKIWENYDISELGKFSLQELYKKRAIQLREKYDYLILYFSGGADSYNVLRSFIDNGIKIDEVCVKWCNATLESNSNIYTPNSTNISAYNYLSEWDFAIKPVLEMLANSHPEIKIEIVDWTKDLKIYNPEDVFAAVNHWHDIEINSMAIWSPSENKLLEKGLTVGSIYGIDKPNTYLEDGKWYMFFMDGAGTMGTPNPNNIFGTEYFYWCPELPLLTFEMANVIIKAFQSNPELMKLATTKENREDKAFLLKSYQIKQKVFRNILYDNWTERFQTLKPSVSDRSDKHAWIFQNPELIRYHQEFHDILSLHVKELSGSVYLGYSINPNLTSAYRGLYTNKFFVRDHNG